jgi:hypothetical protein
MKVEKFNYQGFAISVKGHIPTGIKANVMIQHIKSLNLEKGSFEMQVEHNGYGTISKINFKKIIK